MKILTNELNKHNPELMDKDRLLAITKSDLLDEELTKELKEQTSDMKTVFISSVTNIGIQELKDELWKLLNENWQIDTIACDGKEIVTML